jgi:hypothetical protein
MSNGETGSPASSDERLARFILASNWIRKADQTIKPDAFIPYPYPNLSVTRHGNLPEPALWRVGQDIAIARPATLYGRADFCVAAVKRQSLDVVSQPEANNPNHANVTGWPADKPAQKIIAQELAAKAHFVPRL